QAPHPAAQQRRGLAVERKHPARAAHIGLHAQPLRPRAQRIGIEPRQPARDLGLALAVAAGEQVRRIGMGEVEPALAGDQELAPDRSPGIKQVHRQPGRAQALGGDQPGRAAADHRDASGVQAMHARIIAGPRPRPVRVSANMQATPGRRDYTMGKQGSNGWTRRAALQSMAVAGAAAAWTPRGLAQDRKIGVALVGLGHYAGDLLAPALQLTRHCQLTGLVSGTPSKLGQWQGKYDIADASVYSYEDFHRIADNPAIDVVYIATPNHVHKDLALVAAKAGKHVWCEKPMAMNAAEGEAMIKA